MTAQTPARARQRFMPWMGPVERRIAGIVAGLKAAELAPENPDLQADIIAAGLKEKYPRCCVRFFAELWQRTFFGPGWTPGLDLAREQYRGLLRLFDAGFVLCPVCLCRRIVAAGLGDGELEAAERQRRARELATAEIAHSRECGDNPQSSVDEKRPRRQTAGASGDPLLVATAQAGDTLGTEGHQDGIYPN